MSKFMMTADTAADPVGAALVGLGGWGRQLAGAVARCAAIRIVRAYDPDPTARARFRADHADLTVVDAPDDLFTPDVEALIVATPNATHEEWTIRACEAGRHLFVEKPMADTVRTAGRMIARCAEAGRLLMVGHNTRRHGGHRLLKRLVDDGELGTIVMAEANFSHAGGMALTGAEWRARREECPAVGLMQLGVHHADTLQYLIGPATEATALFAHVAVAADVDDATLALLRFRCGALGYLGSNYATPHRFHIALYGTRANACCDGGGDVTFHPSGGAPRALTAAPVDTLVEELSEFARCARDGGSPETDGEAGRSALAVIEAAILSAEARQVRPVAVSD